jgi:hypothetical protein
MRSIKPPMLLAIVISCSVGALAVLASASKPLDSIEWKIYDRYLGSSRGHAAPEDFVAISDGQGKGKSVGAKEAFDIVTLLEEFEVRGLVLEGSAFEGGAEGEELAALRQALPAIVDRETGDIKESVHALFGAIRAGTVAPKELGHYVDELAAMVDQGGERIKGAPGLEPNSSASPNPTLEGLDAALARLEAKDGYFFQLEPDRDGVLRRLLVARGGVDGVHPRSDLSAAMRRLGDPEPKLGRGKLVLAGARAAGGKETDLVIQLDAEGRALVEWPRPGSGKEPRRLELSELRRAIADEASLAAALESMGAEGLLVAEGAALPSRYGHARRLGEEAAAAGPSDARAAESARADWREARRAFFADAKAYFASGAESGLVAALEAEKARTGASEGRIALIDDRITRVEKAYAEARELLDGLVSRREALAKGLRGSLAFLSLAEGAAIPRTSLGGPADAPYAGAVLAASIISGTVPYALSRAATVAVALALVAAAAALALVAPPLPALALGLALVPAGIGLSRLGFAALGAFVPPLPLAIGPLAAALAAWACSLRAARRGSRRCRAAVASFRAPELLRGVEGPEPESAGDAATAFHRAARKAVASKGGKLAGSEGDSVLAYFEERRGAAAPECRAFESAFALLGSTAGAEVRVGIDSGVCVATGACLIGPAADLAMRLSDLCGHYRAKVLSTGEAREAAGECFASVLIGEMGVEATGRKATLFKIEERPVVLRRL